MINILQQVGLLWKRIRKDLRAERTERLRVLLSLYCKPFQVMPELKHGPIYFSEEASTIALQLILDKNLITFNYTIYYSCTCPIFCS